ncbi:MAG: GNAT family N-acetyltransferase [Alphaproteobacteria bacterium]|nr:GNAT family N-acetyltransferase [Alphaproteobacteria bacterium]
MTAVTLETAKRMAEIEEGAWNACAMPDAATRNPFLSHAFLRACEDSGAATARNGWQPMHLLAREGETLLAALPLYVKGHSYGEYVFDYAWADAWERAGGRYYPKLLSAVPFTPVTGPRLLIADQSRAGELTALLLEGLRALTEQTKVSSAHINFPTRAEWEAAADLGYLQRTDQQFHWMNEGYRDFADFLSRLSSQKRKTLRRERERAREPGITFHRLTGKAITERHWDAFFTFYMDTGSRKWGTPYLTRKFFSLIGEWMADDILLVIAERAGRPIAGAFNIIGGEALYGRNWGAIEHHPFLHFETCYYQAIDFAIERGLKRVEAGAQGAHKLARGYLPVTTYSAHWIPDPRFRAAVANYLEREREAVAEGIEELSEHSPFRREESDI